MPPGRRPFGAPVFVRMASLTQGFRPGLFSIAPSGQTARTYVTLENRCGASGLDRCYGAPTLAGTGPLALSIRSRFAGAYPAAGGRGRNRTSASTDPVAADFQNRFQSASAFSSDGKVIHGFARTAVRKLPFRSYTL